MGAVQGLCSRGILLNQGVVESAGHIEDVIKGYLGKGKPGEIVVDHPVVNKVEVFQRNASVVIKLTYKQLPNTISPFLGFLVADQSGRVLFGSNPALARSTVFKRRDNATDGSVEAIIDSPILRTGSYLVSIFFGDGARDIYVCRDCLTFDYISKEYAYNMRTNDLGCIVPKVEFRYHEE